MQFYRTLTFDLLGTNEERAKSYNEFATSTQLFFKLEDKIIKTFSILYKLWYVKIK